MIQVRNVPDSLYRKLRSRAASEGLSLSDLVLKEVEYVAEGPTLNGSTAADDAMRVQLRPERRTPGPDLHGVC